MLQSEASRFPAQRERVCNTNSREGNLVSAGVRRPHHSLCQCSCDGVHDRRVAGQEAQTWMK